MAFFFKKKRTMEELASILAEDLDRLEALGAEELGVVEAADAMARELSGRDSPPPEAPPRVQVEGRLAQVKLIFIGDTDKPADLPQCQELAAALLRPRPNGEAPLICRLVTGMKGLPFESRKAVAQVFANLMRREENFWEALPNRTLPPEELMRGGRGGERSSGAQTRFPSLEALLLTGMAPPEGPETNPAATQGATQGGGPEDGELLVGSPESSEGESSEGGFAAELPAVPDLVASLVGGCGDPEVALNRGSMLREAIRHQSLAARVLAAPTKYVWPFFEAEPGCMSGGFLDSPNFDVSSDSFATLKDLLTRHKASGVVRDFLDTNYATLFGVDPMLNDLANAPPAAPSALPPGPVPPAALGGGADSAVEEAAAEARRIAELRLVGLYGGLLGPGRNFFTRRQSLKLLAELLLDRTNFTVMMRFIASKHNLKTMMTL